MPEEDVIFLSTPGFGPGGPGFGRRFWIRGRRLPYPPPGPFAMAPAFHRRFPTREEQIAELEAYLRELEAEVKGVREALEELRRGSQPAPPGQP